MRLVFGLNSVFSSDGPFAGIDYEHAILITELYNELVRLPSNLCDLEVKGSLAAGTFTTRIQIRVRARARVRAGVRVRRSIRV